MNRFRKRDGSCQQNGKGLQRRGRGGGLFSPLSRNSDIFSIARQMEEMADSFFDEAMNPFRSGFFSNFGPFEISGNYPKVNISHSKDKTVIEAALPGMKKDDISLVLKDGILKISGKSNQSDKCENVGYHVREIKKSSFSRMISGINEDIYDVEKLDAIMEDGILTITIPMFEVVEQEPEEKKIEIK